MLTIPGFMILGGVFLCTIGTVMFISSLASAVVNRGSVNFILVYIPIVIGVYLILKGSGM